MGKKVRGEQIQNQAVTPLKMEGIEGPFRITFKGPTTSRQTITPTYTAISGATGDTTYTAPPDQDMKLLIIMTQMVYTSSTSYATTWISVNGVRLYPGTYFNRTNVWHVQTVHRTFDVDAGETITIGGIVWCSTTGAGWITNGSGDTQYPNDIIYTAYPR